MKSSAYANEGDPSLASVAIDDLVQRATKTDPSDHFSTLINGPPMQIDRCTNFPGKNLAHLHIFHHRPPMATFLFSAKPRTNEWHLQRHWPIIHRETWNGRRSIRESTCRHSIGVDWCRRPTARRDWSARPCRMQMRSFLLLLLLLFFFFSQFSFSFAIVWPTRQVFTGFHLVLLGFTGFSKVLPESTGFN